MAEAESLAPQELSEVQTCMIPLPPSRTLLESTEQGHGGGAWACRPQPDAGAWVSFFRERKLCPGQRAVAVKKGRGNQGPIRELPQLGLGLDAGGNGTAVPSGSLLPTWRCRPTEPKVLCIGNNLHGGLSLG